MAVGGSVVESSRQSAQFGGEHQAHRYRRAVAPPVVLPPLDRVGQGVPVVEDLAQLRFLLIGRDDFGLDCDGAPNQLGQYRARRVERGLGVGLDEIEDRPGRR